MCEVSYEVKDYWIGSFWKEEIELKYVYWYWGLRECYSVMLRKIVIW